ncbi:hypothetical protein MMC11_007226 [Xylographa trunciseda]|nr:hypothetical protein [Xylographa trunciseda]
MAVPKRALEDGDSETAPQAKKITTTISSNTTIPQDESVQPYLDRIAELEGVIAEYEALVDREGLLLNLPESLETILDARPNAATKLASHLEQSIRTAYRKLDDLDGPDINNDDYADKLVDFLPDINRLLKLQDGPRFAWQVVLFLMDMSRCDDPGNGYNYNDPGSAYFLLDETMLEVAKARWERSEVEMGKESEKIRDNFAYVEYVAKILAGCGNEKYFVGTLRFLNKILLSVYPDWKDFENGQGDTEEGDTGEGDPGKEDVEEGDIEQQEEEDDDEEAEDAEEEYEEKDEAEVENAKEDEYRDGGIGREAVFHFPNQKEDDTPVVGEQFGDSSMSMAQMMDRADQFNNGERIPFVT